MRNAYDFSIAASDGGPWRRGLPRGKYYEGMVHDFQVEFTAMGKLHRRRTPEARAASEEFSRWREALAVLFPKRDDHART